MPTVNLITAETQGVDMQVNPLFLGRTKVHAATNMTFEEGRLRTRPGLNYRPLGLRGQFQGAVKYAPSKGISFKPFAPNVSGLVTVVSGAAHVNDTTTGCLSCEPKTICGTENFKCAGDVHAFQAENYLILQSPATNTYWWDGVQCAEESPGIEGFTCEPYEYQPARDEVSFNRPPCPLDVVLTVLNSATGNFVANAKVTITSEFRRVYNFVSDASGKITTKIHSGEYSYHTEAVAFEDKNSLIEFPYSGDYFIEINPTGIEITVRVIDESTGVIIPGAFVELRSVTKLAFSGFTNSSGNVVLNVFPAEFKYKASAAGYVIQSATLTVDTPKVYTIALRKIVILPPPEGSGGIIVDPVTPTTGCGDVPEVGRPVVDIISIDGVPGGTPTTPSPAIRVRVTVDTPPSSCSACAGSTVIRVYGHGSFSPIDGIEYLETIDPNSQGFYDEVEIPFGEEAQAEIVFLASKCTTIIAIAFVRVYGGPGCTVIPQDRTWEAKYGYARVPSSEFDPVCYCGSVFATNEDGVEYVLYNAQGVFKPYGETPPPQGYDGCP